MVADLEPCFFSIPVSLLVAVTVVIIQTPHPSQFLTRQRCAEFSNSCVIELIAAALENFSQVLESPAKSDVFEMSKDHREMQNRIAESSARSRGLGPHASDIFEKHLFLVDSVRVPPKRQD